MSLALMFLLSACATSEDAEIDTPDTPAPATELE